LFDKSGTNLISYPAGKVGGYTIPSSVTAIGVSAFFGCGLTSITIPNGVTTIGDSAFSGCYGLTSITIPNSVTTIGSDAFNGCGRLTAITVEALDPGYSSKDGVLFDQSGTNLMAYPAGKVGSYTIPSSVISIGDSAFQECSGLTSITIPRSVATIGDWAFSYCSGLTTITIPSSITTVGNYAFYDCYNLTSITIADSVTTIGSEAFGACGLTGVYFWGNAPSIIGSDVLDQDDQATVYHLPGTSGWGTPFGGRPTVLWALPNPVILTTAPSFGVQTNRFGFIISWAAYASVVVEASTTLANPVWSPVSTNTLVNGWSYFSDPAWTNSRARFYRIHSP
jgi:hypothetical protein